MADMAIYKGGNSNVLCMLWQFCDKCGGAINTEVATATPNISTIKKSDGNTNFFMMVLVSCLVSIGLSFMRWFSIPLIGLFFGSGSASFSVFDALFRFRNLMELAEETDGLLIVYFLLLLMILIPVLNIIAIHKLATSKNDGQRIKIAYKFTKKTGIYSAALVLIFMVSIFAINSHASSETFGLASNVLSLEMAPWLMLGCSIFNVAVSTKAYQTA